MICHETDLNMLSVLSKPHIRFKWYEI